MTMNIQTLSKLNGLRSALSTLKAAFTYSNDLESVKSYITECM